MIRLKGSSVHRGIAIGPIFVLRRSELRIQRLVVKDEQEQLERLSTAIALSRSQLENLYQKALMETGKTGAEVFLAHQMLLQDEEYLETVASVIREDKVNAEYALKQTGEHYARMFANLEEESIRSREADIKDVTNRLIRNLMDGEESEPCSISPSVICADELLPSDIARMDPEKILGFVTVHGCAHSHASILAGMMNVPVLVNVPMEPEHLSDGTMAVVDGLSGEFIIDPTPEACREAGKKKASEEENRRLLQELRGQGNVTKSGKCIDIFANIGNIKDISSVLANDAGGIGLLRSEFIYLQREDFPAEEEQYQIYKTILLEMAGRKTVIRTLDIGADKKPDYLHLEAEENPALGCRGIRFCLKHPDIFKTQLRALLRASVYGNLSILYPMIISLEEVRKIKEIVTEAANELEQAGIPYSIPQQGVMIETPAAVMISEELAQMVDFFSIGTNDLTQYTLAIDRQNNRPDEICDPRHPAILRMIKMVTGHAHEHGKRVCICGELGADPKLTEVFIDMGVDELSVSPDWILPLRRKIRELP